MSARSFSGACLAAGKHACYDRGMLNTPARLLMAAALLSGVALAQNTSAPAAAPAAGAAQVDVAKLDALYAQRGNPAALRELEQLSMQAVAARPNDFDLLWRAARAKEWIADTATNNDVKKNAGKEAWDLGERAIKANRKAIQGYILAAEGIGQYSTAVGVLRALGEGLEGKFNDRLDTAIKMDPGYDHAAPLLTKGRYFYELPWPKRDLKKSAEWLEKAIATDPAALRAYYYLAETQLHDGKAKLAAANNAKVLNGSVAYDPAEGQHIQHLAKALQPQIDKELK